MNLPSCLALNLTGCWELQKEVLGEEELEQSLKMNAGLGSLSMC